MPACVGAFIECTSLSVSYDVLGMATVNYTVVHNDPDFCYLPEITMGTRTFSGIITDMRLTEIIGAVGWYETNVTMKAVT